MASGSPIPRKKFTYSGDPSDSSLDSVRFYTGDTNGKDFLLSDSEILFTITENPNLRFAAAVCLESLAARFIKFPKTSKAGPLSKTYGERVDEFLAMAKELRSRGSVSVLPFFGGISQAGKNALACDPDDVKPPFTRDQFDDRNALQFDGTSPDQNDRIDDG